MRRSLEYDGDTPKHAGLYGFRLLYQASRLSVTPALWSRNGERTLSLWFYEQRAGQVTLAEVMGALGS